MWLAKSLKLKLWKHDFDDMSELADYEISQGPKPHDGPPKGSEMDWECCAMNECEQEYESTNKYKRI